MELNSFYLQGAGEQTPIPDPPPPSVGEVVAKCEACKRGFTSHDLLVYHEKYNCTAKFGSANRTDDRTCRYCKATFHLKVALKVHIAKVSENIALGKYQRVIFVDTLSLIKEWRILSKNT